MNTDQGNLTSRADLAPTARKMNPVVKARWVTALRSGEYEQGGCRLRYENKFCCLGVLCNLHAQAHPEIAATQTSPDSYMGTKTMLPDAVISWAGVPDLNPDILWDGKYSNLANANDSGASFAEIADMIEAQL